MIRPPYSCAQCNCKRYLWCTHYGGCTFCLTTTDCPARGGVTRGRDRWVHLLADQEPTTPPIVAHDNGSNKAAVVQTPPRPKKQRKVRSWADTSMPTTTRTMRCGCRNKHPPPTDGGYLSEGDSAPEKRYTKNDPTPRRRLEGTSIQAWMDDRHIFVPTKKLSGAWERCSSQGPGHRPWIGVMTSSSVWTSVIARCHTNPIGGSVGFFLRIAIVLPGSIGLCWGQLLSPPCTCFCGMPREVGPLLGDHSVTRGVHIHLRGPILLVVWCESDFWPTI